jgi:hypothetical protein
MSLLAMSLLDGGAANLQRRWATPRERLQPECRLQMFFFGMLDGDGSWSELHRSQEGDITRGQ